MLENNVNSQEAPYKSGVIKEYSNLLNNSGSWYLNNKLIKLRLDFKE